MSDKSKVEQFMEAIADTPSIEEASLLYKEAWDKACDKVEVPAATTAIVMMAASAVSGAPPKIRAALLAVFVETLNELAGEQVIGMARVAVRAEPKGPKGPIGFMQNPAKC